MVPVKISDIPTVKSEEPENKEEMLKSGEPDVKSDRPTKEQIQKLLDLVETLPKENRDNFDKVINLKGLKNPFDMEMPLYKGLMKTTLLKIDQMMVVQSESKEPQNLTKQDEELPF